VADSCGISQEEATNQVAREYGFIDDDAPFRAAWNVDRIYRKLRDVFVDGEE